jgi:hypothetical protein
VGLMMDEFELKLEEIRQKHLSKLSKNQLVEHYKAVNTAKPKKTGRVKNEKYRAINEAFGLDKKTLGNWRRANAMKNDEKNIQRQRLYAFLMMFDVEIYNEIKEINERK